MGLDIRLPIGLMFTILGLLLTVFGLVSDGAIYRRLLTWESAANSRPSETREGRRPLHVHVSRLLSPDVQRTPSALTASLP